MLQEWFTDAKFVMRSSQFSRSKMQPISCLIPNTKTFNALLRLECSGTTRRMDVRCAPWVAWL